MSTHQIICTPNHPWDRVKRDDVRVVHTDTHEVGEQEDGYPGGDIVTIGCRICGHRWRSELPQ
jgi:hypothetical protein